MSIYKRILMAMAVDAGQRRIPRNLGLAVFAVIMSVTTIHAQYLTQNGQWARPYSPAPTYNPPAYKCYERPGYVYYWRGYAYYARPFVYCVQQSASLPPQASYPAYPQPRQAYPPQAASGNQAANQYAPASPPSYNPSSPEYGASTNPWQATQPQPFYPPPQAATQPQAAYRSSSTGSWQSPPSYQPSANSPQSAPPAPRTTMPQSQVTAKDVLEGLQNAATVAKGVEIGIDLWDAIWDVLSDAITAIVF